MPYKQGMKPKEFSDIQKSAAQTAFNDYTVAFPPPSTSGGLIDGTLCLPTGPVTGKALFLHGIESHRDGGHDIAKKTAFYLAARGIASLRIDFCGHGTRKDEWQKFSPWHMVREALTSIDYLDQEIPAISKTALLGISMGGAAATMIAGYDDRISALSLLFPVLSYRFTFLEPTSPWGMEFFTKEKLAACIERNENFSLYEHKYTGHVLKECKEIADQGDIPLYLDAALIKKVPVSIVHGTNDQFVNCGVSQALRKTRPAVHLTLCKDMPHWVSGTWEKPVIDALSTGITNPPLQPVRVKTLRILDCKNLPLSSIP